ncbi:hypothetical protein K439DRAFT_1635408 [Ramaria rubella]|nr:hypothetical protein K439DRAFT_1635408 [Ramaria rubella]
MTLHRRSTNERVLARHHLKRSPVIAGISPGSPVAAGSNADSDSLSLPPAAANTVAANTVAPNIAASVSAASAAIANLVTVFPPIGTGKLSPPASSASVNSVGTPNASSSAVSTVNSSPTASLPASPAASSSPTPSSPTTTLPSPTPSLTADNRGVSTTPSSTSASANTAPASSSFKNSGGVPSGAIVAIVTVIVLLVLGLVAFLVRKKYQRRRAIKRNTWGAGLVPALENKRDTVYAGQSSDGFSHRFGNAPKVPEMSQASLQSPSALSQPPLSYDPGAPPPASPFAAPSLRAPSHTSISPNGSTSVSTATEVAIVARTFIPSLPDELHISNGEQIYVLNAYDDGWALCANLHDDQGVVPLECLERSTSAPVEMQLQPHSEFGGFDSSRTSRRMSSLVSNAAGTY